MTRPRARMWTGVLAAVAVSMLLLPIAWMMLGSLLPESQLFDGAPPASSRLTLDHYRALFDERSFLVPLRNSLVVAALTTLVAIPVAILAAYGIVRLRVRGGATLLALILAVSVFPQIALLPPLFLALRALSLIDTYPGLVLPYLTLSTPLAVWLLSGFFRTLPWDLEAAAMIDGASRLRACVQIMLPLAAPGIATAAILTFLYCWNEFLFALSFTLTPERHTVPVAVMLFRGRYQVPWAEVLAATVVATVPVAVVVAALQRRIIAGLTAGATKG